MATLCYTVVNTKYDLDEFDCDNPSINRLVQESLYPTLLDQIQTYKISVQDRRVGFIAFSVLKVTCENSDAQFAEYYHSSPSYGAILINFIAVDRHVQHKGIGTTALQYIVNETNKLCDFLPIRLLIVDALRSKLEWYEKRGFLPLCSSDVKGDSETIRMYMDIMPEARKKRLASYIEDMCS